jgi:CS domain
MSTTLTPSFRWAEDASHIFLTIEVESAVDVAIKLDESHLSFRCKKTGDSSTYVLEFELPNKINTDKSSWSVKGRQVEIVLVKAEDAEGYWHGVLKDKNQYKGRVKIDWDLWRDEDEEKALPEDFGGLGGGMPGMGGMGGMVDT